MNCSEYVPYIEPVRKEPTLSFSIWHRFKMICDTITHNTYIKKNEKTRKEAINTVISANIVGMDLGEARTKLSNITIRDYGIDKTQAYCSRRCNVYVDENNIITKIVSFS